VKRGSAAFSNRPVGGCLGKGSAQPIDDPTFRDLNVLAIGSIAAPVQAGKALHLPILSGKAEFFLTTASPVIRPPCPIGCVFPTIFNLVEEMGICRCISWADLRRSCSGH
jgi:hypothetical protein